MNTKMMSAGQNSHVADIRFRFIGPASESKPVTNCCSSSALSVKLELLKTVCKRIADITFTEVMCFVRLKIHMPKS